MGWEKKLSHGRRGSAESAKLIENEREREKEKKKRVRETERGK